MNPSIWGPALWTSLLYIVLSYPKGPTIDVKHDYRQFFLSLGQVLPCMDCRKNYCKHLKVIPIDQYLAGPDALLNWLWRVHNQINDYCGKPRKSIEQFLNQYLKSTDRGMVPQLSSGQVGGSVGSSMFSGSMCWFWLLLAILVVVYFYK